MSGNRKQNVDCGCGMWVWNVGVECGCGMWNVGVTLIRGDLTVTRTDRLCRSCLIGISQMYIGNLEV